MAGIPTPKLREGAFDDRFEVRGTLGAGGFGDVYEAFDRVRRDVVAIKVLHETRASTLLRFKKEFRYLTRLSHPHLVQLYELLNEGNDWLFTMELVRGEHFLSHVRGTTVVADAQTRDFRSVSLGDIDTIEATPIPKTDPDLFKVESPVLDVERFRRATCQLAEGIQALHEAGKLHRDLKPTNVMVDHTGRVIVLDFGMVADLTPSHGQAVSNAPPGTAVPILGTPLYMSPEQTSSANATPASDWYSFGVMLYEAMTGRYPVDGDSLVQILLRKHTTGPPTRAAFPSECPEELVDLCCELLEPDPHDRPTGHEILRRLGIGTANIHADSRADLAESPPFVGRDAQLEALNHALFDVKHARTPQVVNVSGPSGIGKTCVVNEFLDRVAGDVLILEGRCYENESVPYKAIDGVIDRLAEALQYEASPSPFQLIDGDLDALVRLFPVLRRIPAIREMVLDEDEVEPELVDSSMVRKRAVETLGALFRELTHTRDLVVFIDDVQWGDLDSAELLTELFRESPAAPMLLITTHRDNEESEFIEAFQNGLTDNRVETRNLALSLFGAREATKLISELLGDEASDASIEKISREAKGSPFFIDTLARHSRSRALDSGIHSLSDVITYRIDKLPSEARAMLEVIAVAGQPLERQVAREAAYIEDEAPKSIALLRNERLISVKSQGAKQLFETYHDRIRETVRDGLPDESRKRHHLRLGRLLERRDGVDPERLSVHFKSGGSPEIAAGYSLDAAQQARETLAFDRAARLYRDALHLKPDWEDDKAREIWVSLGWVNAFLARGSESADAFLKAAESSNDMARIDLTSKAAEQMIRSGQFERGQALLYDVLQRVGAPTPKTDGAAIRGIVASQAKLWWRGTDFIIRDTPVPQETQVRLDTLWAATNLMGTIDVKLGAFYQLIHLLESLDAGTPLPVARGTAMQAVHAATATRSRAKAATLLATSQELTESQELDSTQHSWLAFCRGMVHYMSGEFRLGHQLFRESDQIMVDAGSGLAWELANVRFYDLFCLLPMGRFRLFSQSLSSMRDDAEAANDFMHLAGLQLWSYTSHLANDDPETALSEAERGIQSWTNRGYHLQHFWYFLACANTALYQGDGKLAYEVVEGDWRGLSRSLLLETQVAHIIALETRARACIGAAVAGDMKRLSEAKAHVRKIEKQKQTWAEGIAALLSAEIACVAGDSGSAAEALGRADVTCSNADMAHWAAAARYRLGLLLGGERGERICVEACALLEEEDITNPHKMFRMLTPSIGDEPSP